MSHYLDHLCRALTERDAATIRALLDDPLSASLPAIVRSEASALAAQPGNAARAPLQAFVFAHRMAQLMAGTVQPGPSPATTPTPRDLHADDRHDAPRSTSGHRARRATAA